MTKVLDSKNDSIDYRLNILGVRVQEDTCHLIAKKRRCGWTTVGLPLELPVQVPGSTDALVGKPSWPLLFTVFQYISANEWSDLAEVLECRKSFKAAREDVAQTPADSPFFLQQQLLKMSAE